MRRLRRGIVDVFQPGSTSGEAGRKSASNLPNGNSGLEAQMKSLAGAHSEAVEEQMRQAERLAKEEGSRPQAEAIWKGVIELYETQPWAAKYVAEAKARPGSKAFVCEELQLPLFDEFLKLLAIERFVGEQVVGQGSEGVPVIVAVEVMVEFGGALLQVSESLALVGKSGAAAFQASRQSSAHSATKPG